MLGFALLLGFNFIGVGLQYGLHVPLPGNVIGLILFTAALFVRAVKLEWVEPAAQFLLSHLLAFFAPVIVGIMAVYPTLKGNVAPVAVSLIVSTLIGLAVAGWITQLLDKREDQG